MTTPATPATTQGASTMPGYQYRSNETPVPDRPRPNVLTLNNRKAPTVVTTKPASPALPVWEEPPAAAVGRKSNRDKIVAVLKKTPGKWARVQDGMKYSPTPAWKKSGCEAVARKDEGTGLYTVWARWPE